MFILKLMKTLFLMLFLFTKKILWLEVAEENIVIVLINLS